MVSDPRSGLDATTITIVPKRPGYSRAGMALTVVALPWVGLVVLGAYAATSLVGLSAPEVPPVIRWFVGLIALAPILIGMLGSLLGPRPGLQWMFRLPVPRLIVTPSHLQLVPGRSDDPAWSLPWGEIEGFDRRTLPNRIEVVWSQGSSLIPGSLSVGVIAGTGAVVQTVEFLLTWATQRFNTRSTNGPGEV
jgi:hypothetical protein